MQILRWRSGNLETRKAEFNRFTVDDGRLSFVDHLQLELTSEINGAGASEPVIVGGKVIGLLTSQNRNICRALPSSFIQSILQARRDKRYPGLGYFDFVWEPGENPASLKFLKLEGEPRGVIIIEPSTLPETGTELKRKDILLQVDGFPVDTQGDYEDPDYGHLLLENLATRQKWAGDQVRLKIWRDGQEREVNYRLPKAEYSAKLVPEASFDQEPEYLVLGGLVFEPLSNGLLRSWGEDWRRRAPFRLGYYNNEHPTKERPAVVVLAQVLPDIYNMGYQDSRFLVLDEVNNQKISRLTELQQALQKPINGYHFLQFVQGDSLRRIVLDAENREAATTRVLQRYGIPKDHVFAAPTPRDLKLVSEP